jgi:hypothetical protein
MSDKFDKIFEKALTTTNKDTKDIEFFEKRAAGAKKIQQTAQEKGGPSMLTSYHFKAKEKPYKDCIARVEDSDFSKAHADNCLDQLKDWHKMTQKEFQEATGRLEAYGEVYITLRED